MPVSIHIGPSKHLATFVATGDLNYHDIREALEVFYKGENSYLTMWALWDLREARAQGVSGQEVEAVAALVRQYQKVRRGGKTAIVSPNDLEYGLARMLSAVAQDLSISVMAFRSIEEAHQWLYPNELPDQADDVFTNPATHELNN